MPLEVIKICGITRVEDALLAAREGATAIGLNFYPGSLRYVSFSQGAMIAATVPHGVWKVGVFVDETPDRILETARSVGLDVVQLHGNESPHDCEVLQPVRVWKALRVTEGFDPASLHYYPCEAILLDTAAGEGAYGGSGLTFPWEVARAAARHAKIIIAGGLDAGNVADAISVGHPWGVDGNSRLESAPGIKDPSRVQTFVRAAKEQATKGSHV